MRRLPPWFDRANRHISRGQQLNSSTLRRTPRIVLALIVALVVSTASVVLASPAAAYGGTISGTVRTTTGLAAPNATVSFLTQSYDRWGNPWVQRAQTTTDAEGQ